MHPSQAPPAHDEELFVTLDRRQVVWRPLGGPTVYKQWRFPGPVLQVGEGFGGRGGGLACAVWLRFGSIRFGHLLIRATHVSMIG